MPEDDCVVYRDDHILVRKHAWESPGAKRVAVQVGRPPEDATPTIVDARELRDTLDRSLGDSDAGRD